MYDASGGPVRIPFPDRVLQDAAEGAPSECVRSAGAAVGTAFIRKGRDRYSSRSNTAVTPSQWLVCGFLTSGYMILNVSERATLRPPMISG